MPKRLLTALLLVTFSAAAAHAHAQATASAAQAAAVPQADPALAPLLALLRERPQDVALSIYPVTPGQPLGAPLLEHNSAQPMPLASSMKIVVLAAYVQAVAAGELDPQQPVTLAEWETFYVLQDGGAHAEALKGLGIPTDGYGRAKDGTRRLPLDTLARVMIQYSDNAATDLLMTRLGRERLDAAVERLGLSGQEPLAPVAGVFTAWSAPKAAELLTLTPGQRADRYWAEAERVAASPGLRQPARILFRALQRDRSLADQLHNTTFPSGTTHDYARLMAAVLGADTGQFAPDELAVMRRHLGWLREVSPENAAFYSAVYLKGGSLAHGVLTDNYALTPAQGKNAGQSRAVSLFLRNLSPQEYAAAGEAMNVWMLRLAYDPAAQAAVRAALSE
ncbi:serine hydrolase [Deinococcus lacus]|uniref:Serine hydrolase n=1 Tax=Deinococcus lacus TaxID=392561 RepID=A0ABW1YCB3_9DEIO